MKIVRVPWGQACLLLADSRGAVWRFIGTNHFFQCERLTESGTNHLAYFQDKAEFQRDLFYGSDKNRRASQGY